MKQRLVIYSPYKKGRIHRASVIDSYYCRDTTRVWMAYNSDEYAVVAGYFLNNYNKSLDSFKFTSFGYKWFTFDHHYFTNLQEAQDFEAYLKTHNITYI